MADRDKIFEFIEEENPGAAIAIDERIENQTDSLFEFPESGRLGRVPGTRELIITQTPYIAAYCIQEDFVHILGVLHGAQLWPDELPGKQAFIVCRVVPMSDYYCREVVNPLFIKADKILISL